MSVTDPTTNASTNRDDPPEFDLDYRFDDREDPGEVTVFPGYEDADITTEWITADAADALTVEQIR